MDIPLGKATDYPTTYSPELLAPIPRASSRARLGIDGDALPFAGADYWNAWELTWLRDGGRPEVAGLVIRCPVDSPNIVESKSLKLYLNSFAMTRFDNTEVLRQQIRDDLAACVGADVEIVLMTATDHSHALIRTLPGDSLDGLDVDCDAADVDPGLLATADGRSVREQLHTDLFRSLCPVTSQPDLASIFVEYEGKPIDRDGLLRYLVSFREHQDFHEACVERIFLDIMSRCAPTSLGVYARFQRRGGIDINPWRTSEGFEIDNFRLWRQ